MRRYGIETRRYGVGIYGYVYGTCRYGLFHVATASERTNTCMAHAATDFSTPIRPRITPIRSRNTSLWHWTPPLRRRNMRIRRWNTLIRRRNTLIWRRTRFSGVGTRFSGVGRTDTASERCALWFDASLSGFEAERRGWKQSPADFQLKHARRFFNPRANYAKLKE
ncbi:MAG: hypothetical protein QOC61_804 [Acidobacteriota bacterium]|jgi:hypothetical protein|nr:hypothetical protein [Acidobacteriota bacterium]